VAATPGPQSASRSGIPRCQRSAYLQTIGQQRQIVARAPALNRQARGCSYTGSAPTENRSLHGPFPGDRMAWHVGRGSGCGPCGRRSPAERRCIRPHTPIRRLVNRFTPSNWPLCVDPENPGSARCGASRRCKRPERSQTSPRQSGSALGAVGAAAPANFWGISRSGMMIRAHL
jgi:hypothetical protein